MNKADILIDIHADISSDKRTVLENYLLSVDGVVTAHFDAKHPKSHGLFVEYDPGKVAAYEILERARITDHQATMSGL